MNDTERFDGWRFGGAPLTWAPDGWFERHEPAVDTWLKELEAKGEPWRSAEHAAFCLVSFKEERERQPSWETFDVETFLFDEVFAGGTAGAFGPPERFFANLVEAMRRFGEAGLVEAANCRLWIGEMIAQRDRFLRDVEASGVHTSLRRAV